MLPVPFIILIVAVLVVNGKKVDDYELSILNHAIKGVSYAYLLRRAILTDYPRRRLYFQSSLQLLQAEQVSSTQRGS
jgi:hypothetical protein